MTSEPLSKLGNCNQIHHLTSSNSAVGFVRRIFALDLGPASMPPRPADSPAEACATCATVLNGPHPGHTFHDE